MTETTSSPTPRECPFCGRSDIGIYGKAERSRACYCHGCGAQGPYRDSEAAAWEDWNSRADARIKRSEGFTIETVAHWHGRDIRTLSRKDLEGLVIYLGKDLARVESE